MASLAAVTPALLLPIPVISLVLFVYNWRSQGYTPAKSALFVLLAVLAAVAGGTRLSVACGEPLRIVAKAFASILQSTLSAISIYALRRSSHGHILPPSFLVFFLSLASVLVICELVSALIPGSPPLLPAALALLSRIILLFVAVCTATISWPQRVKTSTDVDTEKSHPTDKFSRKKAGRVSSPTPGTWPFPASLASQGPPAHTSPSTAKSSVVNLPLSLTLSRRCDVDEDPDEEKSQICSLFSFAILIAQIFATVCSILNVAGSILTGSSNRPNGTALYILVGDAAFTLLWAIAVLVFIQMLPAPPPSNSSDPERQDELLPRHETIQTQPDASSREIPKPRTPKPSFARRASDSPLDFLSLHDPFASSPPPPPPLPPIGLGLDEVDVGWNGNDAIGLQYRFPAPRSIGKGGKRKGKKPRARGRKQLVHQDSSRTLLPVPPLPKPRGSELEAEKDKGFGDEARLAELLLQSLSEGEEEVECPTTPTSPTVPPQAAQMPLSSRWSASTTVRSTMSASISGRSGVSTYVSCTSEKVQGNRISMNTIASVLGSRKSSEARRKSTTTASSSKG